MDIYLAIMASYDDNRLGKYCHIQAFSKKEYAESNLIYIQEKYDFYEFCKNSKEGFKQSIWEPLTIEEQDGLVCRETKLIMFIKTIRMDKGIINDEYEGFYK